MLLSSLYLGAVNAKRHTLDSSTLHLQALEADFCLRGKVSLTLQLPQHDRLRPLHRFGVCGRLHLHGDGSLAQEVQDLVDLPEATSADLSDLRSSFTSVRRHAGAYRSCLWAVENLIVLL